MKNRAEILSTQYEDAEFKKHEAQTNRVVSFFMLIFTAICLAAEILLVFDYSKQLHLANVYVFFPINVLMVLIVVVAKFFRYEPFWIKYMLLGGVIVMTSACILAFTTFSLYLLFVPTFISTRYFNKKLVLTVSVTTLLLFVTICYFGVRFDGAELISLFHKTAVYDFWNSYLDTFVYIVIPAAVLLIFLAIFGINLTTSGRLLLYQQIKNTKKIASVEAELETAAQIQRSVLPKPGFETDNGNFSLVAYEAPAKEVCGDFYDYFTVRDNYLAVIIADVSDKGVPAAMFMMSAKKLLEYALYSSNDLDEVIATANKLICNDNECGMFLTIWMAVIDTKSGVGKYVNAGHPYPIIKHADNTAEYIENEPSLFIGNFPDRNPDVHTFSMKPDDLLFIFTDGLTDAMNKDGESFGGKRVMSSVEKCGSGAEETIKSVIGCVSDFCGDYAQFDDITALALQCIRTDSPSVTEFTVTSGACGTEKICTEVQNILRAAGCPDEKRRNIGVAVDEICNNIAEYAYEGDGDIEFCSELGNNFIRMEFSDGGIPFNPLEVEAPVISDIPQIGGLGIFFVKSLTDELEYRYSEGKNRLSATFIWNI